MFCRLQRGATHGEIARHGFAKPASALHRNFLRLDIESPGFSLLSVAVSASRFRGSGIEEAGDSAARRARSSVPSASVARCGSWLYAACALLPTRTAWLRSERDAKQEPTQAGVCGTGRNSPTSAGTDVPCGNRSPRGNPHWRRLHGQDRKAQGATARRSASSASSGPRRRSRDGPRSRARVLSPPNGAAGIKRMRRLQSSAGRRRGRVSGLQEGLRKRQPASSKTLTLVA